VAKTAKKRRRKPAEFKLSEREVAVLQNWETTNGLSPKLTAVVDSCALATVYQRLAEGTYSAFKDGRATKVTTASIKRRRESLPRAQYKPAPSLAVRA
jgi:hypothetical protein